jgi:hypothetical protein
MGGIGELGEAEAPGAPSDPGARSPAGPVASGAKPAEVTMTPGWAGGPPGLVWMLGTMPTGCTGADPPLAPADAPAAPSRLAPGMLGGVLGLRARPAPPAPAPGLSAGGRLGGVLGLRARPMPGGMLGIAPLGVTAPGPAPGNGPPGPAPGIAPLAPMAGADPPTDPAADPEPGAGIAPLADAAGAPEGASALELDAPVGGPGSGGGFVVPARRGGTAGDGGARGGSCTPVGGALRARRGGSGGSLRPHDWHTASSSAFSALQNGQNRMLPC